ncbi:MAG: glycogen synthase [Candidatus Omnitrophica bacterium]|nr:glycogen synthase [Candidatus Omnitrophota bacterium]
MKILLLTNEYPPNIYGGAGVHVEYLSRALAEHCPVDVRCFGEQAVSLPNLTVRGYSNGQDYSAPKELIRIFDAAKRCLDFNTSGINADLVHVHTWYTHLGGIIAKLNYGIPLVLTVHSLEPLRPWKQEQLGKGYDYSCWLEKTAIELSDAVIAVSQETKNDILRHFQISADKITVIPNGIDLEEYHNVKEPERLARFGIDPNKPYLLFVGRITRQKGIIHLIRAIKHLKTAMQIVLCASSPDTEEIAREMEEQLQEARTRHPGIIWIQEMVSLADKRALYSQAAIFCCPSVYEPFGIINLEAMACETPVVATAVGGIKEAVADGITGILVPVELKDSLLAEPVNPEKFAHDLAKAIDHLMADEPLRSRMGKAGRERASNLFSWDHVARQTLGLYETLHQRSTPDARQCPA